jgi:tetraacyldisaccharide 4'-kinase
MREPAFWWRSPGAAAALLRVPAAGYGAIAARRMGRPGIHLGVPVICVGNFTVGGAGKTPVALALAGLIAPAAKVFFLSRGYGGAARGPLLVEPDHRARDVGDEPLLLARAAPTVVSADRVAGGQAAIAAGAEIIIMDDGFQNPSLVKDLRVLVLDGRRGIGNGCVIPAGPLRAPLDVQLERTDLIVIVGRASAPVRELAAAVQRRNIPLMRARLVPSPEVLLADLSEKPALAFAGIGDPDRFFATLTDAGIVVAARRGFADHRHFTAQDAAELMKEAERKKLQLVTTAKDLVRMQGEPHLAGLAAASRVLPVVMRFEDEPALRDILHRALPAPTAP